MIIYFITQINKMFFLCVLHTYLNRYRRVQAHSTANDPAGGQGSETA